MTNEWGGVSSKIRKFRQDQKMERGSRMEHLSKTRFRIGDWSVNSASGEISRNQQSIRLEARTMRLLLCLAEHAGEVVSIDDLLSQVWNEVSVSPDSVYQAVASLRRQLDDDPKRPKYIETVPRLGYRIVAQVNSEREAAEIEKELPKASLGRQSKFAWWSGGVVFAVLVIAAVLLIHQKFAGDFRSASTVIAAQPQRSIAVLPFLDLTEGMKEEEFADGITEELIDKLSKIPGLQVPTATSSFYFKGKQMPLAEMAKSLGVVYVIDGSVRKSGTTVRVAARLVRAENGYVLWAETYNRPFGDIVTVQDDIAGEVTKKLRAEVEGERR
jgi:transcriptional activator of cad operon